MKTKPNFLHGRWWGSIHKYLTVIQGPGRVIVDSVHRKEVRAWKRARELSKKVKTIVGVLSLFGNTRNLYKRSDTVDMEDIHWPRAKRSCSQCCHPYVNPPFSLIHSCHLGVDKLTGDSLCNSVKACVIFPKIK